MWLLLLYPSLSGAAQELEQAFPNLTFDRPVCLEHGEDGSNRLFVVEQSGIIYVFDNNQNVVEAEIFMDIRDRVNDSGNEEGLLGLAFHPDYPTNGYFYVDYTATNPRRTVIARYTVSTENADKANVDSEHVILEIAQPYSNHNGGQLAFGPDMYLYIAMGDGGSGGDPQGNGQNLQTLLGAILRIDVDKPDEGKQYGIPEDNPFAGNTSGYREEIYAYGLRNPWRFSFDPMTGRLWTADVGQNEIEEVDITEPGKNYGWNVMEGTRCYNPSANCDSNGLELPVWEYDHSLGQSITGGYVYRGSNVSELAGAYIYADYVSGRIWSLRYDGINPPVNEEILDTELFIASFGVDADNELYICAFNGKIYRFKPTASSVETEEGIPVSFSLAQNFPNPFNPSTAIRFNIPADNQDNTSLRIYDFRGAIVRTFSIQGIKPGIHSIVWDGTDNAGNAVASGLYLYQLQAGGFTQTQKMILTR
ncbi:MAG: PQQ-dependent sugar dehydrogenase [Candidatus Latescibacteria bacterium]|nr:PQQ-dependent sugar dehydrogenase [Candidatus Latescibacterota bacterium]